MAYRSFPSSADPSVPFSLKPLVQISQEQPQHSTGLDVEIKAHEASRVAQIADRTAILVELTRINAELAKSNHDKLWTVEKKFDDAQKNVKKAQHIIQTVAEVEEAKAKSTRCMLMFLVAMLAVFFLVSNASR